MAANFDFDAIYADYPRKEGKAPGMRRLEKTITSEELYERFKKAVHNYRNLLRERGTETKYFLLWSTFCNGRWEDYEDTESLAPSRSEKQSNRSLAERILNGEL